MLTTAYAGLTERGLAGLSMREIAARLGVAPNALYSHVAGKADLVDALLDATLAEVAAPEGGTPRAALTRMMTSTYDVLLEHPALVPFYFGRLGARGPNAERLGEVMLVHLARAGVTGRAARDARRVLIVHAIGLAAMAAAEAEGGDRPLSPAQLRDTFRRGLFWLLDGILRDRPGNVTGAGGR